MATIVDTSQPTTGYAGSMGCFNLPTVPSRNRDRETCCHRSTLLLHDRHFTVYSTLLDRNDSAEWLRC